MIYTAIILLAIATAIVVVAWAVWGDRETDESYWGEP